MEPRQRAILRKRFATLREDMMDPKLGILDLLYQNGVLEADDVERIEAEVTRGDRVRKLVDRIMVGDHKDTYELFLKALDADQPHLSARLRDTSVSADDLCGDKLNLAYCDPCDSVGRRELATETCVECNESMCKRCALCHRGMKLSKGHKIFLIGEVPPETLQETLKEKDMVNCPVHSTEKCKLFCRDCGQLICLMCKLSEHISHSCVEISKAAREFRASLTKKISVLKASPCTALSADDIEIKQTDALRKLDESVSLTEMLVQKRVEELSIMLNDVRQDLCKKATTMHSVQTKRVESAKVLNNSDDRLQIESYTEILDTYSDAQLLLNKQDILTKLHEAEKLISTLEEPSPELFFHPSSSASPYLRKSFGGVYFSPRQFREFKVPFVREDECLVYLDTLENGDILIGTRSGCSDSVMGRILVCDKYGGKHRELAIRGLTGVGHLRDGTIVTSVWCKRVQEIQITPLNSNSKFSFPCLAPVAMTTDRGSQIIVLSMGVSCDVKSYDRSGSLLWSITYKLKSHFSFAPFIATSHQKRVVISDPNDSAVRMYEIETGEPLFVYNAQEWEQREGAARGVDGVCVDGDGAVFVADMENHCISRLSSSGHSLGRFLTAEDKIHRPVALSVTGNGHGHLVCGQRDGWVKSFKYKWT